LATITSDFGHDGFLLEIEQIENALAKYIGYLDKRDNNL
jgi:homoserine acetyltransferase